MEDVRLRTADVPVSEDQIKEEYDAQPQAFDTPAKAHTRLALITKLNDLDKIKQLMEKDVSHQPDSEQLSQDFWCQFVGD